MGGRSLPRITTTVLSAIVFAAGLTGARSPLGALAVTQAREAGTLRGVVFDSTSSEPLPGATVAVLQTSLTARTDSAGAFHIDGVPPGRFEVSFYHERLQELGVSPSVANVEMAAARDVRVELAIPSRATLLLGWCAAEGGRGEVAVGGVVRDLLTGVPVPGARVRLLVGRRARTLAERRTDATGSFRFCRVPGGSELAVRPDLGEEQGRAVDVAPDANGTWVKDVYLSLSRPGTVVGTVVDGNTSAPVDGAVVTLRGTGQSVVTDENGAFRIRRIPPGRLFIETEHIAYGTRVDSVTVQSEETLEIRIDLTQQAIALDSLLVLGRTRGVATDLARGTRFDGLTRVQIDSMLPRVTSMADLIRNIRAPGLTIREMSVINPATGAADRALCIESGRRRQTNDGGCNMVEVYLNDAHLANPQYLLEQLDPQTIERIEYLSAIEAGARYGGPSSVWGVVLISTR